MKTVIFTLCIAIFVTINPIDASKMKGSALKTEKMSAHPLSFPEIKSLGPEALQNLQTLQLPATKQIVMATSESKSTQIRQLVTAAGLKPEVITLSDNHTIRFLNGELGSIKEYSNPVSRLSAQHKNISTAAMADLQGVLGWCQKFSGTLGLTDAANELSLINHAVDNSGNRHLRFRQMFQNIPVWAEELYVHINAQDQIYAVNGAYEPTPHLTNLAPAIPIEMALQQVQADFTARNQWHPVEKFMQKTLPKPKVETVIWFDFMRQPHLVWFIDVRPNVRDWYYIFVDANSGEILHRIHNHFEAGFVNASGMDLNATTRQFRAYQENSTYYLLSDINEFRSSMDDFTGGAAVYDFKNQSQDDPNASASLASASNANLWPDRSAVSAMYHTQVICDYYKNTHGRRSFDDSASTIVSVINVLDSDGEPMDNAYWNGTAIWWGNGNKAFKPLAGALDVAAHEFQHGVTEYTASLIYEFQSGALNEAYSDFFGAMVDRDDWLIGEDIIKPVYGIALRDMANPANPQALDELPTTMDEFQYLDVSEDQGGVHVNCGIINRASYLIADKIGRAKAEKIYYRALVHYLVRQSEFIDARLALEQSAKDLYGTNEIDAVKSAFDAVKITSGSSYNPTDNDLNITTGGIPVLAYVRDDLKIGLYRLDTKQDIRISVKVGTKQENGTIISHSQLSTTADGKFLFFVNEDGKIASLDIENIFSTSQASYFVFDDIKIIKEGDIWNAAITRDGKILAFTSIYENDRNLYFYFNNKISYLELDLPGTQEGISVNTIQYADVLDWSPNCKYRKLAFDAYNEMNLSQNNNWWSMGEVEFSSNGNVRLQSLLPPQPQGYSVGNVEYSSLNPDKIAFNIISQEDNYWDLQIRDFDTPANNKLLKFPNRNLERPTYSPDDQKIIINTIDDNKLLMLNIQLNQASYLEGISSGARNAEWFILNPNYFDTEVPQISGIPSGFTLRQNYPNPFNPETTIEFSLPLTQQVTLKIYDIQGREIQTLVNATLPSGTHKINFAATELPSGVYFYTINTEKLTETKKLLLLK